MTTTAATTAPPSPPALVAVPVDDLARLVRAGLANPDGAGDARRVLRGLEERLAMPLGDRDARELHRVARDLKRLVADGRRLQPRVMVPAPLWGPIAALAKACLRNIAGAGKARGPVMALQQALDRLGSAEAKAQGAEILRLLDADARSRHLEQLQPPPDAAHIGPTPETRSQLKRDVVLTWWERDKLSDAGFGAATEIRDIADSIAMAEHPAQPLVRVRVDGGGIGMAPVERLSGVLSSKRGKRYLAWLRAWAAEPVTAEPDTAAKEAREEAAAAAGMSVRTGSLLDVVMAVVVNSQPIANVAKLVRLRKEKVVALVIEALEAYAATDSDRLARLGIGQAAVIDRAQSGNPVDLPELVFLDAAQREGLGPLARRDPTEDRPEPAAAVGQFDQAAPWGDPRDGSPRIARVAGGRLGVVGYRPVPIDTVSPWLCREIRADVRKGRGDKVKLGLRYGIEPAAVTKAIEIADDFDRRMAEAWWAEQVRDMAP